MKLFSLVKPLKEAGKLHYLTDCLNKVGLTYQGRTPGEKILTSSSWYQIVAEELSFPFIPGISVIKLQVS